MILVAQPVAAQGTYPFEGQWDCGSGRIALDGETYFNGSDTLTFTEIEESGDAFLLRFADGSEIALSAVTDTAMEWMGDNGISQTCARVE